jgi:hypothetical protein
MGTEKGMTVLVSDDRGRVACGEYLALEIVAYEILAEDRRNGSKRIVDQQFWLSEEQFSLRYKHEVYNKNGVAEASLYQGMYRRAYNPLMAHDSRPRRKFRVNSDELEDPYFDVKRQGATPHANISADPWGPTRSPWWNDYGYHGLDRYQRCRIRRAYWSAGSQKLIVKAQLAEKYGVPPWVISRVAISSRS